MLTDQSDNNNEIFLYLGFQQDIFFFIHTVYDQEKYKQEYAFQVYNCMINETMIQTPDQAVIIYEIRPNAIYVIVIQHTDIKRKFNKKSLEVQMTRLLQTPNKDKRLIFSYDLTACAFYTYEEDIECNFGKIEKNIHIDNVYYAITTKPISYLD